MHLDSGRSKDSAYQVHIPPGIPRHILWGISLHPWFAGDRVYHRQNIHRVVAARILVAGKVEPRTARGLSDNAKSSPVPIGVSTAWHFVIPR